jgi:NADH-quinone oxidoreductase subunit C
MKEETLKQAIEKSYENSRVVVKRHQRIAITTPKDSLFSLVAFLKEKGFKHLSFIACVDWIEQEQFELVYHLASYADGIHAMVKTMISRSNPVYISLIPLFKTAQTYEREIHEMFGVDFVGNARLTPFLLTNWQEIPPFRKDFDTEAYAKRMFEHE